MWCLLRGMRRQSGESSLFPVEECRLSKNIFWCVLVLYFCACAMAGGAQQKVDFAAEVDPFIGTSINQLQDKNAPIRDSEKEIAGANNPRIRLLFVNHRTSGLPTEDINGHWTQCTPEPASSLPSPISSAAKSPKKNRFRLA